jgi:hypothetical protein
MSDLNIVGSNNPPPPEPSAYLTPTVLTTLPIGTPVAFDAAANNTVQAGLASAIATSFVAGLLTRPVSAGDVGLVQSRGPITLTTEQWDALVTGESGGLTRGPYYLSAAAAGKLVTAQPSAGGDVVCLIGYAISSTQMILASQPQIPVTEGDS